MDPQIVLGLGLLGLPAFVLFLAFLWEYSMRQPPPAGPTRFEKFLVAAALATLVAILAALVLYVRHFRK